jgi:hypothetical protein
MLRPRIGILHEHPDWFRPLFDELDRRGLAHVRIHPSALMDDPAALPLDLDLVFNRMSPSGFLRGLHPEVAATAVWLRRWEEAGVRVVNGSEAWATELSKARQLRLLEDLGLPYPAARPVTSVEVAREARELGFPLVVKPDVGGSGAGIARFDSEEELDGALRDGLVDLGPTALGLVQAYVPFRDGCIQRVEVVGGKVIYGIRVYPPEGEFNLCPADACRTVDGAALERTACPVDAADAGLRVEGFEPSEEIVREVEAIAAAGGIEVGGIEYAIHDETGERLYYDINALSNFVADGPVVIGFDPFVTLVDWMEEELERARA